MKKSLLDGFWSLPPNHVIISFFNSWSTSCCFGKLSAEDTWSYIPTSTEPVLERYFWLNLFFSTFASNWIWISSISGMLAPLDFLISLYWFFMISLQISSIFLFSFFNWCLLLMRYTVVAVVGAATIFQTDNIAEKGSMLCQRFRRWFCCLWFDFLLSMTYNSE